LFARRRALAPLGRSDGGHRLARDRAEDRLAERRGGAEPDRRRGLRVKLLVTGANGQLGRALVRLGAVGRRRAELDLGAPRAVAPGLDAEKPDVVVNAAAYTAVDRAESEPVAAFAANEAGARAVAAACAARGVALVHVSTDYVFDGEKPTAYVETDATAPL